MFLFHKLQPRQQLLESDKFFGYVNKYRTYLIFVNSFADWVYDLFPKLLHMASKLATHTGGIEDCYDNGKKNEFLNDSQQSRFKTINSTNVVTFTF